ncbi:MAG: SMP-30/gluconolactonase/LRE family protein [Candidatus Sumerlaeota bacterium]|nr:SMP-30/gluconolactonase/LRE family protein [Candidatus Sumerlaeota bacterium]
MSAVIAWLAWTAQAQETKAGVGSAPTHGVVAPGAKLETLGASFQFTEGPTVNAQGDVFFSDTKASRTYQWRGDKEFSVFRENTNGANGLYFDRNGNLLACEGDAHRVVSVDPQGAVQVLADQYNGVPLNKPNDLWIDPKGGVYFTDPVYGGRLVQDGEHVYYITPDRKKVIRVISDMVRPNGLVGTPDGATLYVSDHGGKKIYKYQVKDDGTLTDKTLFAAVGSDGMTIDAEGNIYLTEKDVLAFDPAGNQIDKIDVPVQPTNLCFVGKDRRTLLITARTAVYAIQCRIPGIGKFQGAGAAGKQGWVNRDGNGRYSLRVCLRSPVVAARSALECGGLPPLSFQIASSRRQSGGKPPHSKALRATLLCGVCAFIDTL